MNSNKLTIKHLNTLLILNTWGIPIVKAGQGVQIGLNKKLTKFSIYDISKALRSKKARSDSIRVRDGGQQSYQIVGSLIKLHKNSINSNILFRNSLSLTSFEMMINIFSPLINYFFIFKNKRIQKNTGYYLRTLSAPESKINFDYVISQ